MKTDDRVVERMDELLHESNDIHVTRMSSWESDRASVDTPAFRAWATSAMSILQRVFGEDSIHFRHFSDCYRAYVGYESAFRDCVAILQAARDDYVGGYLFQVRDLIHAEVLDDVLEQASELLHAGYKDAACVVAGVALESTLRDMCARSNIQHGKLDRMNADLSKAGVYNKLTQKQITAWAGLRNSAAHGQWDEYDVDDVKDMQRGITRFIADHY